MKPSILFPQPLNPSAELFANQISYVLTEFAASHYTLHVRPHFVSGAPQCVSDSAVLAEIAKNEYDGYLSTLGGEYGSAAAGEAKARGISRICFISWRNGNEVLIYDVLTRTMTHLTKGYL